MKAWPEIKPFGSDREIAEKNIKKDIEQLKAAKKYPEAFRLQTILEARILLSNRMGCEVMPRDWIKEAKKKQQKKYKVAFYNLIQKTVCFIINNDLSLENFFIKTTPEEVLALTDKDCMDKIVLVKCGEYIKIKINKYPTDHRY